MFRLKFCFSFFQLLQLLEEAVYPQREGFSFFQLLLTLPALDLHVTLRVYKS